MGNKVTWNELIVLAMEHLSEIDDWRKFKKVLKALFPEATVKAVKGDLEHYTIEWPKEKK